MAARFPGPPTLTATPPSTATTSPRKQTQALPLKPGVNTLGGNPQPYSPDGSKLLFFHNGADSPQRRLGLRPRDASESQQVTHALVGGLRSADMVAALPRPLSQPRRQVDHLGLRLRAQQHPAQRQVPRHRVHPRRPGRRSSSIDFNRLVQYVVNQGYLVIAPNYRGSTGFGKEFMDANYRDEGGNDLNDVLDAAEWIKKSALSIPRSWSSWAAATAAT